ncbi:MAG: hypothetical protein HZB26_19180 [Candidatus Hydrogenedentes bacterium]|nr:hypothetical protein [Candidatus Hydrogenedentota bacterium]
MRPEDFWRDYVGGLSVRDFLGPEPPDSIEVLHAKVQRHIAQLPALYGLTLQGGSWKKTCTGFGHNSEQVADGIICYLEARSADWENRPATPLVSVRTAPPLDSAVASDEPSVPVETPQV